MAGAARAIPDLQGEGCWGPLTLPVLPEGGCFILGDPSAISGVLAPGQQHGVMGSVLAEPAQH